MRISTLCQTTLVLLLCAGAAAWANSLDRDHSWTPTEFYPQQPPGSGRDLIPDGSFEQGPPPNSGWTETSLYGCEWIGDHSGAWYVSSWDGYFDYWAGGYCYDPFSGYDRPETSSVSQFLDVPDEPLALSFFYVSFRPDSDDNPPDGDRAYVAINGVEVWTLPFIRANDTYPEWVGPILIDLCEYAGQTVELTLGGISVGDMTGNLRFDFFELIGGQSPAATSTWGAVKSQYR